MVQRLEQANAREASRKLDYLIDHVEKEIEHAEEKMMALENSGYDMDGSRKFWLRYELYSPATRAFKGEVCR